MAMEKVYPPTLLVLGGERGHPVVRALQKVFYDVLSQQGRPTEIVPLEDIAFILSEVAQGTDPPSILMVLAPLDTTDLERQAQMAREALADPSLRVAAVVADFQRQGLAPVALGRSGTAPVLAPPQRLDEKISPEDPTLLAYAADLVAHLFPSALAEPDYRGDQDFDTDLLDVGNEIGALASLVASRRLKPPLSIGLFGDWGTGKTFFMRNMQRRVAAISEQARASERPQAELAYYKHIVQIEFNAWHYVEGELWASLMDQIFRSLAQVGEDKSVEAEIRARVQEIFKEIQASEAQTAELKAAEKEAEQRRDAAKADAEAAEEELQKLRRKVDAEVAGTAKTAMKTVQAHLRSKSDTEASTEESTDAETKDKAESLSPTEALATVQDLSARLRRLGPLAGSILGKDRQKAARALLLVFVGALGLWSLGNLIPQAVLQTLVSRFLAAGTALMGGGAWMMQQLRWVQDRLDECDEATAAIVKKREEAEAAAQARFDEAHARLRAAAEELAKREKALATAHAERQRLQRLAESTSPSLLMQELIDLRTGEDGYQKHLGLVAQVRDDFERISELVKAENRRVEDPEPTRAGGAPLPVNRIILYIDDLDRCPEENVIEVLQAVHLLLAFPLFVVVVGVDVRWVSRALETHYAGLLGGAQRGDFPHASPQDYLEKIFQLPYWVRRLDKDGAKSMLAGLMRDREEGAPISFSLMANEPGESDEDGDTPPRQKTAPKSDPVADLRVSTRAPIDLEGRRLDLEDHEKAAIEDLADLLTRSPRSLKRFLNVYHVVKASLGPAELRRFADPDDPRSRYQQALFLLAVGTGFPTLCDGFFRGILGGSFNGPGTGDGDHGTERADSIEELVTLLRPLDDAGTAHAEWHLLKDWLDDHPAQKQALEDMDALREQAPFIARFTFRIQQRRALRDEGMEANVQMSQKQAPPPKEQDVEGPAQASTGSS